MICVILTAGVSLPQTLLSGGSNGLAAPCFRVAYSAARGTRESSLCLSIASFTAAEKAEKCATMS